MIGAQPSGTSTIIYKIMQTKLYEQPPYLAFLGALSIFSAVGCSATFLETPEERSERMTRVHEAEREHLSELRDTYEEMYRSCTDEECRARASRLFQRQCMRYRIGGCNPLLYRPPEPDNDTSPTTNNQPTDQPSEQQSNPCPPGRHMCWGRCYPNISSCE